MYGDVNGDGNIDNLDVTPFIVALTSNEGDFGVLYPDGAYWRADTNFDGNVDNLDITPFVNLLAGGGAQAIPEPATLSLLALSGAVLIRRRKRA